MTMTGPVVARRRSDWRRGFPILATNSVHVYCAMMVFEGNRQASIQTATDPFGVSALRVHGRTSCRTGGVSPRQQRDQLARFSSRERSKPAVCVGHATSLSYFGRSPFAKLSIDLGSETCDRSSARPKRVLRRRSSNMGPVRACARGLGEEGALTSGLDPFRDEEGCIDQVRLSAVE